MLSTCLAVSKCYCICSWPFYRAVSGKFKTYAVQIVLLCDNWLETMLSVSRGLILTGCVFGSLLTSLGWCECTFESRQGTSLFPHVDILFRAKQSEVWYTSTDSNLSLLPLPCISPLSLSSHPAAVFVNPTVLLFICLPPAVCFPSQHKSH